MNPASSTVNGRPTAECIEPVVFRGDGLTINHVHAVAAEGVQVQLDPEQLDMVQATFERVQEWGAGKRPMYGVNTGFGELIHVIIPPKYKTELQENLIRSHAAGAGNTFGVDVVRAILSVRLNCLMKGYSGVSSRTVNLLQEFLNRGIHPVIPEQGSLGASGDLAPLSHVASTLIGEGDVWFDGQRRKTADVMKAAGLERLELGYKEGLALVNGTSAMTGAACLALVRARNCLSWAVATSAYVVQCLRASTRPFDDRGHLLKNHNGQIVVAREIRRLLKGSQLTRDHANVMEEIIAKTEGKEGVCDSGTYLQDAYSLRCMPQVLGVVLETFDFSRRIVEEEVNSANDNPLAFDSAEESFHGANFHGQYVAMACDYLNVALTEIGVLAERQLNRLVDPHLNGDLPGFLAPSKGGLACGFEGGQYLATSIASENLDLAAPSSVKSLPSNGSNQDVVSMGLIAARKSLRLVDNVTSILTVLLAACRQAGSLGSEDALSEPIRELHDQLAQLAPVYHDQSLFAEHVDPIRGFLSDVEGLKWLDANIDLSSYSANPKRTPT